MKKCRQIEITKWLKPQKGVKTDVKYTSIRTHNRLNETENRQFKRNEEQSKSLFNLLFKIKLKE